MIPRLPCSLYFTHRTTALEISRNKGESLFNIEVTDDGNFRVCNNWQLRQLIPGESPSTILANKSSFGNSGKRMSQLMFYVPRGLMKRFSGGFFVSISSSGTDLKYLTKILIFSSFKFE